MERRKFIKTMGLLPLAASCMRVNELNKMAAGFEATDRMPVLFVGHGSPMNAIEDNAFSRTWRELGTQLPRPKAILCISAHWETKGTFVTAMEKPKTIHDFGGFPTALFEAEYPAPGSPWLAGETKNVITTTSVESDMQWGLDHGCWSVLAQMFPGADIPVIEMSLDYTKPPQYHFDLAMELSVLRNRGVLILGSGNMVHNLGMVAWDKLHSPAFAFDWALEADAIFKQHINTGNFQLLANYESLGKAVKLAVPTPEHYLPMLYTLALKHNDEKVSYFNDVPVGGSLTMTSLRIEAE